MEDRPEVDRNKLRLKLQRMRCELKHLSDLKDRSEEEFMREPLFERAATRMLQISIEAMIDIGNHIIAREGLGVPQAYRDTVTILTEHGILPQEDRDTFTNMIRFRNRAVHLYDTVSAKEVYSILRHHLPDFDRFIAAIVQRYFEAPERG